MRLPRSVGTTFGIRLRTCATQAFVVPRSMPMSVEKMLAMGKEGGRAARCSGRPPARPALCQRGKMGGAAAKSFGLKKTLGLLPARVTFVIDKNGVIQGVYSSQLKMKAHSEDALDVVQRISKA